MKLTIGWYEVSLNFTEIVYWLHAITHKIKFEIKNNKVML